MAGDGQEETQEDSQFSSGGTWREAGTLHSMAGKYRRERRVRGEMRLVVLAS